MNEQNAKTWTQMLADTRALKKQSMATLYDRVVIYKAMLMDREFIDHCYADGMEAYDFLDEEVADINCGGIAELMEVHGHFPERSDWEGNRLERMIAEIMVQQKKRPESDPTPRTNWKEKAKQLQDEVAQTVDWKEKAALLERELVIANAKIEELEKLILARPVGV